MNAKAKKLTAKDGHMMARFLASFDADPYVAIGNMAGFPNRTDDPAVVEEVAAEYDRRAVATKSKTRELVYRSKAIRLRRAAADLAVAYDIEAAEWFQSRGAIYVAEKGIEYGALREMGVPADTLKEAGITR